ncbi:MAG: hypothetical protein HN553_06280, partial [Opitutae bacterium]|nr:hypothetical protein [Opitutae bacterium]
GTGANYNYGNDQISDLMGGSSGSSGRFFQGSGAGGGALELKANGDLTISPGVLVSANGGDGRTNGGLMDFGGGGSGGALKLSGKNIYNNGLLQVLGGNLSAGGGRIVMAAGGTIEKGLMSVGSGTFKEVKPPVVSNSEQIYLSYKSTGRKEIRKTVSTRPNNLVAYWPMDEGDGTQTVDALGRFDGSLIGGATWVDGYFGKGIKFDGSSGYVMTQAVADQLDINGKKPRTISFWVKVDGNNPQSEPGFYGYGETSSSNGMNKFWGIRNIKDGGYTQLLSQHWGWNPRAYHSDSLLERWAHFAHTFNGSELAIFMDGSSIANWTRSQISTGVAQTFQFGRWRNDSRAYFGGTLDDMRVYDIALSENEIQQIFSGQDLVEDIVYLQHTIDASGDPTSFSSSPLPTGLSFNSYTGEITGRPFQVGIFDLNVSATNLAGIGTNLLRLVVDKAAPVVSTAAPRNVTSSTASFSALIDSDGGDPPALSLFWGDNDGGLSSQVDLLNDNLWDYRVDLNGTHPEGIVTQLIEGLSKGENYYYRWMASNSVSSGVWSLPPQEGIKAWWKFDESSGNFALDEIGGNNGTLVAMDSSDHVFGRIGNALRMNGAGEHISVKGFKGIVGDKPRTIAFWVKTSTPNGAIINWGEDENGANWAVSILNGSIHLNMGGSRLTGNTILHNNSWRHIAMVLPRGAKTAKDVFVYVDGRKENVTSGHDFDFAANSVNGLSLWLDASDLSTADSSWFDKSGNNNHATKNGSPEVLEKGLNKLSVMKYSGANGQYHSFDRISDIRTVFAVVKYNAGYWYLLGDTGSYDFHGNGVGAIFHSGHAHNSIKNGSVLKVNGSNYSLYGPWPREFAVISLRTSGNVRANNFSNDRNYGGRTANGELGELLVFNTALSDANMQEVQDYLDYKWGFMGVNTSEANDFRIGTDENGNHFSGIIDEVRLYEHSLSSQEINSIALNGTMKFQTSMFAVPPVVEIVSLVPQLNGTALITGNLVSKDSNNPTVTLYYGTENGGFDTGAWDNFVQVSSGQPLELGEFNATVTGLIPGETYYFRTFAQSADGEDWSSGAPEVIDDLMSFWRFDEESGYFAYDSTFPTHLAKFEGEDNNISRSDGYLANGLSFDGGTNWLNLDFNQSGYLENSFSGRTVSFRFKASSKVYTGPAVTEYQNIAAYIPFDEGTGNNADDLSFYKSKGIVSGGSQWVDGLYGKALSFDGVDDTLSLGISSILKDLHKNSYSLSFWVKPTISAPGKYTNGQLNSFGFNLPLSESYFSGTDLLFSLNPSGSSILTSGPEGTGLAFANDDHFKNAGIGITNNDNYMSLFVGAFQAKEPGTYTWEVRGNDNRGVLWIDLDQDGSFEQLGDLGAEKILDAAYPNDDGATVTLSSGYYPIALVHAEQTGGSSINLYFSAPSSSSGPTSLTLVNPSDPLQSDLFVTENLYSLAKRGPFSLLLDGDHRLSFNHSTASQSVALNSDTSLTSSDWTHVGVVVDYNSSSVKLYQNSELMDEDVIPDDSPVNLLASEAWNIGGSSKISKDFFTGQIDDLRFYNVALSESDINATYLDDLTGTQPAGYENQTLYDEGSEVSGLGIVLEGNQLKAKVAENGSLAEVSSDLNLRDDQWHHAVVSFGDSPRTLKLYLDGAQQGEAAILDYSTVSLHPDAPSFGRRIGTNVYSDFGNYKGQLDNLRIYDRGLVETEVISIYDGDSPNDGFLEFLAIEKAEVQTLSPVNVLPTQATIRAEVLSIGGEINLAESIVDKSFSIESIPGMQAWYSVQDLDGDNIDDQGNILSNGDQIIQWMDGSGQSRNMAYTSGNPRFYSSALNGKPVISFDGNDMIWGDTNFDFLTNTGYTIVSLARYTGGRNNRVISSRSTNWLFGFHGGLVSRFYANGWISTGGPSDNDWHLHLGTIEAKGGNPAASFWKDGVEMVSGHRGSNNTNFGPGVLQFGGYRNNSERSTCEIAEVMVFEKELNQLDRAKIEGYLAHKWRVNESLLPSTHPYFATNPYGGIEESTVVETVGGDKPILKIFWGDEWIDANSTLVSDTNDSYWDYVLDINGGDPVSLGIYEASLNGLTFDKTYYYRAYTQNLGGEQWASEVKSFTASDTRFTKYTMDGLVLWFDAMDLDGDGERDQFIDGNTVPLWVDKSVSQKNALQTVPNAMPSYAKSVFNSNPGIRFGSGESFNVGSL